MHKKQNKRMKVTQCSARTFVFRKDNELYIKLIADCTWFFNFCMENYTLRLDILASSFC